MIRLNTPRVPLAPPTPPDSLYFHNHARQTNDVSRPTVTFIFESFSAFKRTKKVYYNGTAHELSLILQQKKTLFLTDAHTNQVNKYEKPPKGSDTRIREKEQFAGISGQTVQVSNIIEDIQSSMILKKLFYLAQKSTHT